MKPAEKPPKAWAEPVYIDPVRRNAFQNWLAHVEAGRIGADLCTNAALLENGNPPCPPEVAKRREERERLFARLAGRL